MKDAIIALLGSRKFIVMMAVQLGLLFPAYFGKINPDTAAELAAAVFAVWSASHAHEESAKIKAGQ